MRRRPLTERTRQPARHRSGVLSLEVVLVLPILLVLLCGLFEISMLMFSRSELVEASRAGARLGTLSGVTYEEVQWEATRAAGRRLGPVVEVDAQLGQVSGDEVIVTVRAPMSAAAPDLLWPVGFGLQGRELIAQTRMRKE
jgi:hypothetical protein